MKYGLIIRKIYSKKSLARLDNKIALLGSNAKIDTNLFLSVKLLLMLVIFAISFIEFDTGYIAAPIITFAFYFLYDFLILDLNIKKRSNELEHDAIFFFEILSLTLQSDNNIKLCLKTTSEAVDSELSREFSVALRECEVGKSLTEALENLKRRIPSKIVNNVILNIIEANVYGNSLQGILDNEVEYIMDKRIMNIKGKINKMPTKISIISVLLFIPLIMILILGPVLISYFIK